MFVQLTHDQCSAMFAHQIEREADSGRQCTFVYAFVGHPHLDVVTLDRFAVDMSDIKHTLYDKVVSGYSILTDASPYSEKFASVPICDIPLLIKETLQLGDPPKKELVID